MRLRNKKTGEIIEVLAKISFIKRNDNFIDSEINTFDSLAKLNEEWEDYQEPKEYWYIEPNGVIARIDEWDCCTASDIEIMKSLGNYFETKEEAEKALEKLKAWQRLKQAGLRLSGYQYAGNHLKISANFPGVDVMEPQQRHEDLELLFGGEE